ncbi:MAG: zeta toxin family protein [Spirosomaceae bacterium]|jgi:predicted ABC-type ATPase|nr:zeta toxin family protein [Spirosomataceae bacterium]
MPQLYIIAGPNGAGKTTAAMTILPEVLHCDEFVNADAIAVGLSPFQPEKVAMEAGRLMLQRIDTLLNQGVDFAIETTLSTKSYANFIRKAKTKGYEVTMLFLWLNSVELAKARVKKRVLQGGHNIPTDVIERRYERGLRNFFTMFSKIVDNWLFYDNSSNLSIVADSQKQIQTIFRQTIWQNIRRRYES